MKQKLLTISLFSILASMNSAAFAVEEAPPPPPAEDVRDPRDVPNVGPSPYDDFIKNITWIEHDQFEYLIDVVNSHAVGQYARAALLQSSVDFASHIFEEGVTRGDHAWGTVSHATKQNAKLTIKQPQMAMGYTRQISPQLRLGIGGFIGRQHNDWMYQAMIRDVESKNSILGLSFYGRYESDRLFTDFVLGTWYNHNSYQTDKPVTRPPELIPGPHANGSVPIAVPEEPLLRVADEPVNGVQPRSHQPRENEAWYPQCLSLIHI